MKTTVYSWRVSSDRKAALEHLARRQKRSISQLLDEAVGTWLEGQAVNGENDEAQQERLHAAASRLVGRIGGGDPSRATEARNRIRERLQQKKAARK